MQITVLKVLAGHPEGRTSIAELTRYVAVLMSSGTDWSLRMKALAARAPSLDIFSSGYVLREMGSWSITDLGRTFLTSIEAPVSEPAVVAPEILQPVAAVVVDRSGNVIHMEDHQGSAPPTCGVKLALRFATGRQSRRSLCTEQIVKSSRGSV